MPRSARQNDYTVPACLTLLAIVVIYNFLSRLWSKHPAILILLTLLIIALAFLRYLHVLGLRQLAIERAKHLEELRRREAEERQRLRTKEDNKLAEMELSGLGSAVNMEALSPRGFEQACERLFRCMGYRTKLTVASADEGVDIEIWRDNQFAIIQCKHYFNRSVGNMIVRELIGTVIASGADSGYLLTSGYFTQPAQEVANRESYIYLWDQTRIIEITREIASIDFLDKSVILKHDPPESRAPQSRGDGASANLDDGTVPIAVGFGYVLRRLSVVYESFADRLDRISGPPYRTHRKPPRSDD